MDDFKLPTIPRSVYDEVESVVRDAQYCTSEKALRPYVQRLDWIRSDLPLRASYKIGELSSMLRCYCNRNMRASQEQYRLAVANHLATLKSMVE